MSTKKPSPKKKLATMRAPQMQVESNVRLGVTCSLDARADLKFVNIRADHMSSLDRSSFLKLIAKLCLGNAVKLYGLIDECAEQDIGCLRVCSAIWPRYCDKEHGYTIEELPNKEDVLTHMKSAGLRAKHYGIRLVMHPDDSVVLNANNPDVVTQSIATLEYHNLVASYLGVDVINVHVAGVNEWDGNRVKALEALHKGIQLLSHPCRQRLTLENDPHNFSPRELLPFCQRMGVPFVYDVHHHRCKEGGTLSVSEDEIRLVTTESIKTWNGREPLIHISSPIGGWEAAKTEWDCHHEKIDFKMDYPKCWQPCLPGAKQRYWTLEVEAKGKDSAVRQLQADLTANGVKFWRHITTPPPISIATAPPTAPKTAQPAKRAAPRRSRASNAKGKTEVAQNKAPKREADQPATVVDDSDGEAPIVKRAKVEKKEKSTSENGSSGEKKKSGAGVKRGPKLESPAKIVTRQRVGKPFPSQPPLPQLSIDDIDAVIPTSKKRTPMTSTPIPLIPGIEPSTVVKRRAHRPTGGRSAIDAAPPPTKTSTPILGSMAATWRPKMSCPKDMIGGVERTKASAVKQPPPPLSAYEKLRAQTAGRTAGGKKKKCARRTQ